MQKLQTVNAETLLYEPLEKPSFVVDSLIPTGLSLFCGSQKIGKSWLMLKLCLCVSQGIPLWDMPTMEGDVLYLCLEDTFCRIQDRLFRLTDEASGRLHFAVASCKLSDGLIVQLEDYLKDYPNSRLIVIDTLQKVRTASKDNAYASDYGDISLIKDFADRHSLAVIVVHHIRKQNDSDVFNKVSGTTGLTGSADATFVLEKEKRASDTAKLYVTGRDTPYQEYTLRFRDCSWELVERKTQEQLAKETIPDVLFRLVDFMRDKDMNRFADKNKVCVFIRTAIANRHFMVAMNIVGIHRNSCHCTFTILCRIQRNTVIRIFNGSALYRISHQP